MSRGSMALPAALAALAVSAALGAAVAELARIEVVLARHRRSATAALLAADACVAEVIAGLPAGWDFAALLAGPDGLRATADDGALTPPPGCQGGARPAPGPVTPPRALLQLEARAGEGRRVVEAVVGLAGAPGIPALLWLGAPPEPGAIVGTLELDGVDPDAPWAGLAAPEEPELLDGWLASEGAHVLSSAATASPITAPSPPLAPLGERVRAAGPAGAEALRPDTPSPALAYVAGDLEITDALRGTGILYVEGALDIEGSLDFTGVVVASGGLRITTGGSLTVSGALWIGAPTPPGPLLQVDGSLGVRRDGAALAGADGLLPLPRQAVLLGLKDLG